MQNTIKICFVILFSGIIVSGCQTAQKTQAIQEIVPAETEASLSNQLTTNLVRRYGLWPDPETNEMVSALTAMLVQADPKLKSTPTEVKILLTQDPIMAPGFQNVIYVSRGMLQTVHYENELAYVIALQLSFIKEAMVRKRFAELRGSQIGENILFLPTKPIVLESDPLEKDWFEPGGLFDFGSQLYLNAQREAIHHIYQAKFDPRGCSNLIQKWNLQVLSKILPDQEAQLKLAREEVAKLSPLRDPIVNTVKFEKMQARVHAKTSSKRKTAASH